MHSCAVPPLFLSPIMIEPAPLFLPRAAGLLPPVVPQQSCLGGLVLSYVISNLVLQTLRGEEMGFRGTGRREADVFYHRGGSYE